jgi:predicted methyltransferase
LIHLGETPFLITPQVAKLILEGRKEVSLDLGLSEVEFTFNEQCVLFPDGSKINFGDLKKVSEKKDAVFFSRDGELFQIAINDDHYFKLVPTDGAPTLEIDGVRMHRTARITPDIDAELKLKALEVRGGRIFDTCTGLGYTALAALRKGSVLTVSVERHSEVLRIAALNPWSKQLFTDRRMHLLIGDVFHIIDALPENFFDFVIHDPPRFSHAGELYSGKFYSKLYDVLREGGKMYHYTGEPGSKYRRVDIKRGVMQRLRQAGFFNTVYYDDILGVISEKPK